MENKIQKATKAAESKIDQAKIEHANIIMAKQKADQEASDAATMAGGAKEQATQKTGNQAADQALKDVAKAA